MKLGLSLSDFTVPGGPPALRGYLTEIAQQADAAGFDSLWVMDHFFQIVGPAEAEMLEGYSVLAFAAAVTSRIALGSLVTGVTYRYPALLVKTVTTLDVLTGGRAMLGLGAAWFEREHRGLGVPWPSRRERFERLEETLQIARRMFAGDATPYVGRHAQLAEPINSPAPLARPHPPILVGGGGEQKTLRLVAQYADACNIRGDDADLLRHKLEVLQAHCAAVGRPYDEIERTSTILDVDTATSSADLVDRIGRLADGGIQHVMLANWGFKDRATLDRIARDVLPQVHTL